MSSTVLLATALTSMCVLTADLPVHRSAAWHNDHASNGSARLAPRRTTGDGAQKLAACLTTKPEDVSRWHTSHPLQSTSGGRQSAHRLLVRLYFVDRPQAR